LAQLSGALGCGRWAGALLLPVKAAVSGEPADARNRSWNGAGADVRVPPYFFTRCSIIIAHCG
jgi:hypothetical protein